jgi:REP element-mobilizing transposase RayT
LRGALVAQSLANLLVHAIFSTKEREPFLGDAALRQETHQFLAGISEKLDCPVVAVGGVADHVHLLARLARTIAVAEWIKELKRSSSIWIKETDADLAAFQWQSGYGVFSVSQSLSPVVADYIARQEEHHRGWSFQDEFRVFLKKHDIECDETQVWD